MTPSCGLFAIVTRHGETASFPLILSAYREAYEQWIEIARQAVASGDVEMSVKKAEKLWPFDQR
jgi:hypothetical protein